MSTKYMPVRSVAYSRLLQFARDQSTQSVLRAGIFPTWMTLDTGDKKVLKYILVALAGLILAGCANQPSTEIVRVIKAEDLNRKSSIYDGPVISYEASKKPYDIKTLYPFGISQSLVIYASSVKNDRALRKGDIYTYQSNPLLIIHNIDAVGEGFKYYHPYPDSTYHDSYWMLKTLDDWLAVQSNSSEVGVKIALETTDWVKKMISEGWTHFHIVTEAEEYAGNSFPWAYYHMFK